jgi:Uncharacterised nucleotidyltransferase
VSRRPAWLPRESHEVLLRAALGDRDQAVESWRRWSADATQDDVDAAALQILPLAWRNVSRFDDSLPKLGHARGVYRYVWVKNQVLLRFGARMLCELDRAGVGTLVLKGAALSVLHYRDLGVRLMVDFDVLVPRAMAPSAISVLRTELEPDPAAPPPEDRLAVHHSASFTDGPDRDLDLHWYSLWQSSPDEDFWAASVPIEVGGVASRSLCSTDHLLQVCAHGAVWQRQPVLRWVTDAMVLIASGDGPDWGRLVEQARKRELTLTMADALGYLASAFDAPVPEAVLRELRESRRTLAERVGRRAGTRPTTMVRALGIHWERYQRLKRVDPAAPRAKSFPAHLRRWWGHHTYPEFVRFAIGRALHGREAGRESGSV